MSLKICIDDLLEDGKLTAEQAKRAHDIFDETKARHRQSMGEAAADAAAGEDTVAALEYQAERDRVNKLMQIDAQRRIIADTASYDGGKGDQKPGAAALAILDHDGRATYDNVAVAKEVIKGRAHALMEGILNTFSRDLAGRMRNPAAMANVLRELFGKDTKDVAAKELARAWEAASEFLRQRFNAAGGAIGKLEHWGLPQTHDGVAIRQAGYKAWRDYIVPRLDRVKMQDGDTGLPFTDAGLERMLSHVYDTVTTDGWIRRDAGGFAGSKLANARADERFLHFSDADAWTEYHDRFGGGTSPFEAMIGHIDGMARDTALMERLGPNPAATVRWMQDGIRKDAAIDGRRDGFFSSPAGDARAVEKLYDLLSGRTAVPVNAAWARGLGAMRSWQVASKLGSAMWSAVTDTGFQAVTRGFNGLPVWGAVTDHLRLMASAQDRQGAIRMGLIAHSAGQMAGAIHQYTGESATPGVAARLGDAVLRLSGLEPWTQTGKWAYGMGELSRMTDMADRGYSDLPGAYRDHLARYGIDGTAWDGIRGSDRANIRGADFIDPTAIADQQLGDRVLRMILTETAYAVPVGGITARARAMTSFGQPGTLAGEVGRNALQFKSFGISLILTHGRRVMSLSPYSAAKYGVGLFITTTLLGALGLQAKQIITGRDLLPMDTGTFWLRAIAQGGGFGIFGDLAQSQVIQQLSQKAGIQRASGLAEVLAGPVVGMASDAAKFGIVDPIKDAGNWWEDEPYKGNTAKDAIHFARSYMPFGNLWYTRAAFERLVLDNLQTQIDPSYQKSWAMMEQHAHLQGQDFWWRPGETMPERAPQLGTNP